MFPIIIKQVEHKPPDLSARAHREIARASFNRIGQVWQDEMLKLRFSTSSPNYPRKKRTDKWLARKRALAARGKVLFGGQVDNVATGNMMQILLQPGIVRAFPTRVSIHKQGPRYIGMRPYKSNQPDKWAELTWLSDTEKTRLSATWLGTYDLLREQRNETRTFSTS